MDPSYAPIDCGLYDHLELFAVRETPLDVDYVTPDGTAARLDAVRLVTIRQRSGEELGVFRTAAGAAVEVRLDRLRSLTDRRTGQRLALGGPDPLPDGAVASGRSIPPADVRRRSEGRRDG